ncbi:MAG: osmoprotectant ABC transporter substrate-binding protein [Tissierellaceae bacterium]|nr:osmoprotectant ABC transporter substrate-binding protein [Tissierellaceae bacterium]
MNRKIKFLSIIIIISILLLSMAGCSSEKEGDVVRVGGKNFSEQYIMADMLRILIEEKAGLETTMTTNLAGNVLFDAIKSDQVDLYLEYTGTGLVNLGRETIYDPDEVYRSVKEGFEEELQIKWLEPYGFNNTYAMVVTKETAEKYNLKTISDMAAVGEEMDLGCTYIFTERDDGYPGLSKHYDFEFNDVIGMDPALMYQALVQGSVDVISAFATEGRISAFDLVILEDDKQFFPPYDAAPIVRMDLLEKHPEIEEILNLLANKIDDIKMAELNAAVDLDKREPEDVARDFLIELGLID